MVAPLWTLNTIKFVLPEKVGQSSLKFFRGCYPLRPPIMPNFIEIGQISLETGGYQFGLEQIFFYSVTDGQKRDYLSRDSQRATINGRISTICQYVSIICLRIAYFRYGMLFPARKRSFQYGNAISRKRVSNSETQFPLRKCNFH